MPKTKTSFAKHNVVGRQFTPGHSIGDGKKGGNLAVVKGKAWKQALTHALETFEDKDRQIEAGQALTYIAKEVVKQATQGLWSAIDELGNRLDGRPAQSLTVGPPSETPIEDMTDDELAAHIRHCAAILASNSDQPAAAAIEGELTGVH